MADPIQKQHEDLTREEAGRLGMNNRGAGLLAAGTTPAEGAHLEARWRAQQAWFDVQAAEAAATAAGPLEYEGGERRMRLDAQVAGNQTLSHTPEAKAARARQAAYEERRRAAQELERRRAMYERAASSVRLTTEALRREHHQQAVKAKQAALDRAVKDLRPAAEITTLATELEQLNQQS